MTNNAKRNEIIKIVLLIGSVGLIFFGWHSWHNSSVLSAVIRTFESTTGKIIDVFSLDLEYRNSYLFSTSTSTFKSIIFPEFTFPFLLSLFPLLFIYVRKFFLNFFIWLSVLVYFILRAAFITILYFDIQWKDYQILLNILDSIRYIPFYLILIYIVSNNKLFKSYYLKIKEKLGEALQLNMHVVIILLILNSIPRILITFIYPELLDNISHIILKISNSTFSLFEITTTVQNSTIHIAENWIYLGHGCLGLGLITMVIILIASTRSPLINKLLFITILLPIQVLLNSLRIDLLVIYYYNNWDLTIQPMDMHDYSNLFIYSLGFVMFLVYWLWFQDLKIVHKPSLSDGY